MLFFSNLLVAVSATTSIVHARALVKERDTTSLGTFYAYASNISGLSLSYGDGIAYIGNVRPTDVSVATNVTFSEVNDQLIATSSDTTLTSNGTTPRLFIDQSVAAFVSAGFTTATNTSVTTTGFDMFGTLLVWASSAGELESKWYAAPTRQEGL
ncbi:hypothetical protein LTR85_010729 [Meristemomyces frigidus]|nr:hypothetical protein LTR85_010729 [Meristemomyces frigidus]